MSELGEDWANNEDSELYIYVRCPPQPVMQPDILLPFSESLL